MFLLKAICVSCIAPCRSLPFLIADLCIRLDALSPTTGSNPIGGRFLGALVGVLFRFRHGYLFETMLFDLFYLDLLLEGEPRLLEPESVDITIFSFGNI